MLRRVVRVVDIITIIIIIVIIITVIVIRVVVVVVLVLWPSAVVIQHKRGYRHSSVTVVRTQQIQFHAVGAPQFIPIQRMVQLLQ